MLTLHNGFEDYLSDSYYINWKTPEIREAAQCLLEYGDEVETVKKTYEFVRDKIGHSWDVQDKRITITATDVLREGVGICWAKANLLAALLRANGIPSGICYQRLTLGDTPETGYCVHALNAVYLKTLNRWIRLDARGNKPGIQAEMCLDGEKLAFPVRVEFDEIDYKIVYAQPFPLTMEVLESNTDALYMYLHCLPDKIP